MTIRMLRLPAVMERVGLGRDSIYRKAKAGLFPRPIKISEHASGWVESEIEEYLAKRIKLSRSHKVQP